jgi:hypothetical protein
MHSDRSNKEKVLKNVENVEGIVMILNDYRWGLDWQLDLLNSHRSVTTSNYNRFTNSHILQFTRAHTEVFSARCIFTSLLVTVPNSGRSLSSGFPSCPWPQLQQLLTNWLTHSRVVLLIIFRHGPHRKYLSSVAVPLLRAQPSARTAQKKTISLCCYLRAIT